MATSTDLIDLYLAIGPEDSGDDSLAILTEMEGNRPLPNLSPTGRIWGWEVGDDIYPADNDGKF